MISKFTNDASSGRTGHPSRGTPVSVGGAHPHPHESGYLTSVERAFVPFTRSMCCCADHSVNTHTPSLDVAWSRASSSLDTVATDEWRVQSDVVAPDLATTTTTVNETVMFSDTAIGESGGITSAPPIESTNDQTENIDLIRFLSRPVRISNFTWLESDAVGTVRTINPWNLFFTDARVGYKLNNFGFIQCTLKLKIMINASPFYYGAMGAFYQPLPNFTPTTIIASASTQSLIPLSQRPCVWLNPQHNEGAMMDLPFFWHKNWLNAQSAGDMTNVGKLDFVNYTTLQSANGATGTGVSVAVYAWAEDVKLSGPSVGLAVQSDEWHTQSDEYGQGAVSRVSSAVAKVAGRLKSVPVIGQFATATELGASAVSSVAKLFGFTNVPVISDTVSMRSDPFPKLATTEVGYPIEKLTVDAKNELAIDGAVVGLPSDDEMAIGTIIQKPSYLASTTWSTASAVDTILFTSVVTPVLMDQDTTTAYALKLYTTPMAWVSNLFNNWRGDVIFTFKVVASPFHKGRLRISFDPSGYSGLSILNSAASSNVVFTKIVDLADATEVDVRIPYQQAIPFLYCDNLETSPNGWSTSASPPFTYDNSQHNGTITVRVHNILTAPIASSTVSVLVFVRAAENLEFANPREINTNFSLWPVQAEELDVQSDVIGTSQGTTAANQYVVNFGEKVASLRTLLRRQTHSLSATPADNTTSDFWIWSKWFSRLPIVGGFDPDGLHQAKSLITPANTVNFNFVHFHPITYVMSAFVAYRGSVNWTINVVGNIPIGHISVHRSNDLLATVATVGSSSYSFASGSASVNAKGFLNLPHGGGGMTLTNQNTQTGLAVQLPNQSAYIFQSTDKARTTKPSFGDGSVYDLARLDLQGSGTSGSGIKKTTVHMYAGIGTDFGVHFFLNTPTLVYLAAVTAV